MKAPEIMRGEQRLLETERDEARTALDAMTAKRDAALANLEQHTDAVRAQLDVARKRIAALEAMVPHDDDCASEWCAVCACSVKEDHPHGDCNGAPRRCNCTRPQRLAGAATESHQGDPCERCGVRYVDAGPVCPGTATEPAVMCHSCWAELDEEPHAAGCAHAVAATEPEGE